MKRSFAILLCMSLLPACAHSQAGLGWKLVNGKIRREFPEVPRITTAELAGEMTATEARRPLLLDVRTPEEFAVSHLRGAERIDPAAPASAVTAPKERAIVTYCSVGYRSAALAQRLRAAGFTKVRNLEGSIFQWANEGRPVFREGHEVAQVHPYNGLWGLLLDQKRRAELPAH